MVVIAVLAGSVPWLWWKYFRLERSVVCRLRAKARRKDLRELDEVVSRLLDVVGVPSNGRLEERMPVTDDERKKAFQRWLAGPGAKEE